MTDSELMQLSERVGQALKAQGATVSTAESCTGGWIAKVLTDIAGSSAWFERGFVTYSNEAKSQMIGVSEATLAEHGAVSEPVVRAMVQGAVMRSHAQVAVAVTGVAGPTGGSPDKPVGTVWLGWCTPGGPVHQGQAHVTTACCHFPGDRAAVRQATVQHALGKLAQLLGQGA